MDSDVLMSTWIAFATSTA